MRSEKEPARERDEDEALRRDLAHQGIPPLAGDFTFDRQRWQSDFGDSPVHAAKRVQRWPWTAAAIVVLAGGFGAGQWFGHGSPGTSRVASPGEKHVHRTTKTAVFLAAKASPVIVQAMQALGHPAVAMEAPQTLPYAKQGPTVLSATAKVWGGHTLPTYDVELWATAQAWPVNSPHIQLSTARRLATFSGTNYSRQTTVEELTGLEMQSGYSVAPSPGKPVTLGKGLSAEEHHTNARGDRLAATSITWHQKRWDVVVNAPSTAQALQHAKALMQDIRTLGLPTPTQKGYIVVNLFASTTAQGAPRLATQATVTWNQGAMVYQVQAYSDVQQRMDTALAIAHTMRLYEPAQS
jgi:hypothetical protein